MSQASSAGGVVRMELGAVLDSFLFVLLISAVTVSPFVIIIGGVMVMKWAMTPKQNRSKNDGLRDGSGEF